MCFDRLIEDHFWHTVGFYISSDSRRCQIFIWTLRLKRFEIDSLFLFTKKCFVFSIRKILSVRSSKISEKNDISTSVFSIVIRRTNRLYAASKYSIFSVSNALNQSKMLHDKILMSERWLMQSNMFVFEIWYSWSRHHSTLSFVACSFST
jgi:hypothetical protein